MCWSLKLGGIPCATPTKKDDNSDGGQEVADSIHFVLPNAHISSQRASLFVFEDKDVVIKMIIKGQSLSMRHISRTHRVNQV